MGQDELIEKLAVLLENLGFDYDRMSVSGQETYNDIMSIMVLLTE